METTVCVLEYDRESELKAFDETKSGVKGLVDGGLSRVPLMFIHPKKYPDGGSDSGVSPLRVPLIDLEGVNDNDNATLRVKIVDQVREACENWGIFHVVNHGILLSVLEEMIDVIRRFHEQDTQLKRKFYKRDIYSKVCFVSNFDLFKSTAATWRDSVSWTATPNLPHLSEFPAVFRDIVQEYSKQMKGLGHTVSELLSEALGLNPNHLKDKECAERNILFSGHYYPPCPEPELARGSFRHADSSFFAIVLQDQVGGFQVLHQNQWIDVPHVPGALAINVGISLQVITNDRFKAIEHRVLVNRARARVSATVGFETVLFSSSKILSPINELINQENPPKYKEATLEDHFAFYKSKGV